MYEKFKKYIEQNYYGSIYENDFTNEFNLKKGDKVFYFLEGLHEYEVIAVNNKSFSIIRYTFKKQHSRLVCNDADINNTLFLSVAKFKTFLRRKIKEDIDNKSKEITILNKDLEEINEKK